jgi:hypothetical protein
MVSKKGLLAGAAQVRVVKGIFPIAASLTLMVAVTAVLWHLKLTTDGSKLVYIYLFPVALIAALYSGRLARIVHCDCISLRRLLLAGATVQFRQ